jgi:DNA mismatch repair protein MutS
MRQFARFKERHPDCILLFRIGDFYETFDDDAVTIHKALGLTLTKRAEGVPMAGVPHHQLENYLRRLIQQGFRVAVCEQVQDPKDAAKAGKPIVERAVTRVLTPGTLVEESLLDESAVNRLAAVSPAGLRDMTRVGVALVEASTGAFTVLECDVSRLGDELAARSVQELLYPESSAGSPPPPAVKAAAETLGISLTPRPSWHFRPKEALEEVLRHYGVSTVAGFGLRDDELAISAAGAVLRYLKETQAPAEGSEHLSAPAKRAASLAHLLPPRREECEGVCVLDAVSLRSLEVERTIRGGGVGRDGRDGSLVGLFAGACVTPMGKRLVREWLCRPLGELGAIQARHARVGQLVEDRALAKALTLALDGVQDVARISGRIALGRATPRDLVALGKSLARVEQIAGTLENAAAFAAVRESLLGVASAIGPVARRILAECVDGPPAHLREGGLIRDGVDAELDEAKLLQRDGSAWLVAYQERLIEEHKLPGVKVGFNKVFGYYIELTASQARGAPAAFSRKQTLKNAERYITPELQEYEEKVTTAEARAIERERVLFDGLCEAAAGVIPAISAFGLVVAELDVVLCFAQRAVRKGWVRPEMTDEPVLAVRQGRHPVLEEVLGERFVPNDVEVGRSEIGKQRDSETGRSPQAGLALITGPNMAGKSTFIRQMALIVLLAHAGSFVPAEGAAIGVTDRIFTRVGADDALHAGQSTFMVEMTETATILNNVSERSLVILDEIGRGTSTLDGLSLAWAIAEFLAGDEGRQGPRTLFATHYHELTDLEERLKGSVRNLHVSVREWGEEIVFLHRILPGRTSQSYGVHVAKLAGIPESVVGRAREVLSSLAVHHGPAAERAAPVAKKNTGQLPLFTEYLRHPAVDSLREIKLDAMTPMQAFDELRRLKEQVGES